MIRTIWGDPDRYAQTYWSRVEGAYFTGDAARRDAEGYYWVLGRVDDVMNVSGHRLSTMELESALVRHPAVAEAAVVGKPHEITGQAVACFVTLSIVSPLGTRSGTNRPRSREAGSVSAFRNSVIWSTVSGGMTRSP